MVRRRPIRQSRPDCVGGRGHRGDCRPGQQSRPSAAPACAGRLRHRAAAGNTIGTRVAQLRVRTRRFDHAAARFRQCGGRRAHHACPACIVALSASNRAAANAPARRRDASQFTTNPRSRFVTIRSPSPSPRATSGSPSAHARTGLHAATVARYRACGHHPRTRIGQTFSARRKTPANRAHPLAYATLT